ncbi:putative RNAse III [Aspergillus japonicus CBS 114.51]|uniref:Putative RNAse III n=1 Tax=Aspergillus japonicus CBS 114.51 TaxID=1448312 RepID=A0A8T8WYE0_ASPJA|nr:putative RNAse III [Aspergillus japonicus CBS 114.51]RAH80835.1 putative RNAse III [Aspergillus japonicus CBS 114.51]
MTSPYIDLTQEIGNILGYQFRDSARLEDAFRAAGVNDRDGNKRLALVGITALQLFLQTEGQARRASREQINKVVSHLASNINLAERGFELGLDEFIENNPCQGDTISNKVMAATMEAIIGAVFLESHWDRDTLGLIVNSMGLSWPDE